MLVARLHSSGDIRLQHEEAPLPGEGEVIIRVACVGICGSDLHWYRDGCIGDATLIQPLVLGHEFTAITDDGIRVVVDPNISCGKCEYCIRGDVNLCPGVRFAGHSGQDGALRELMTWPGANLHPLPDSINIAEGTLLEPLGVALHAFDLGKVKSGMSVGIFGCGPIGLLLIQLCRNIGARTIVATDLLQQRLDAAGSIGATQSYNANDWNAPSSTRGSLELLDLDVVFEAAGTAEAVDDCFLSVKPGGKVILIGIPAEDTTHFTASVARRKGLTIKLVRRMRREYPRAIELVKSKSIDLTSLISHHFPLSQVNEAFEVAERREGIKVIIDIQEQQ